MKVFDKKKVTYFLPLWFSIITRPSLQHDQKSQNYWRRSKRSFCHMVPSDQLNELLLPNLPSFCSLFAITLDDFKADLVANFRDFFQACTTLVLESIKHCWHLCTSICSCSCPVTFQPHPSQMLCPLPLSPTAKMCSIHCRLPFSLLDPLSSPKIHHVEMSNTRMPSGGCPHQNLSIQSHANTHPYPIFEFEPNLTVPCPMSTPSLYTIHPYKAMHLCKYVSAQHVP